MSLVSIWKRQSSQRGPLLGLHVMLYDGPLPSGAKLGTACCVQRQSSRDSVRITWEAWRVMEAIVGENNEQQITFYRGEGNRDPGLWPSPLTLVFPNEAISLIECRVCHDTLRHVRGIK